MASALSAWIPNASWTYLLAAGKDVCTAAAEVARHTAAWQGRSAAVADSIAEAAGQSCWRAQACCAAVAACRAKQGQ